MRSKHLAHAAAREATSAIGAVDESGAAPAVAGIPLSGIAPANENWPIVVLVPTGNDTALVRALVRVLVRRALISEGVFSGGDACDDPTRAE